MADEKRPRWRLRKLEIDRVDIVDRPSNPESKVALFKRAMTPVMGQPDPEYDEDDGEESKIKITVEISKEGESSDSPFSLTADGSSSAPPEEKGNPMTQPSAEQVTLAKSLEDQIQELEKSLKARDEEIANLKATVAKSEADPEPVDIWKGVSAEVRKQFEAVNKRADESDRRASEAEAIAKRERDERLTREYIAKAEQFKALPVNPPEFGVVLKGLFEKAPEEAAKVSEILKAADAQLEKSGIFKEIGSAASGENLTAYQQLQGIAKRLVESGEAKSMAEAIGKAAATNHDLYMSHRKGE